MVTVVIQLFQGNVDKVHVFEDSNDAARFITLHPAEPDEFDEETSLTFEAEVHPKGCYSKKEEKSMKQNLPKEKVNQTPEKSTHPTVSTGGVE